jgi:hypothetical protein
MVGGAGYAGGGSIVYGRESAVHAFPSMIGSKSTQKARGERRDERAFRGCRGGRHHAHEVVHDAAQGSHNRSSDRSNLCSKGVCDVVQQTSPLLQGK